MMAPCYSDFAVPCETVTRLRSVFRDGQGGWTHSVECHPCSAAPARRTSAIARRYCEAIPPVSVAPLPPFSFRVSSPSGDTVRGSARCESVGGLERGGENKHPGSSGLFVPRQKLPRRVRCYGHSTRRPTLVRRRPVRRRGPTGPRRAARGRARRREARLHQWGPTGAAVGFGRASPGRHPVTGRSRPDGRRSVRATPTPRRDAEPSLPRLPRRPAEVSPSPKAKERAASTAPTRAGRRARNH